MRILVVGQHYWPEPFDLSTDICEGLAERGHEVTMLTGMPNYPQGELYEGYEGNETMCEERNGVRIVRTRLHPRKTGVLHRVWNYYSFSWNASQVALGMDGDFDIVLSLASSPVMMANPAIRYAALHGRPLLLYVIDIWPECLTAGGIKRGSAVYNHYKRVSHDIYERADTLLVTSPLFEGYLRETVGVTRPVVVLPQLVEAGAGEAEPLGCYDASKFNITFAGNVGKAQSVETIVCAAAILRDYPHIAFHVVGGGSELESCKALATELGAGNITFYGQHPSDEMPAFYAASDAMLATFSDDETLSYTLPRKIQSYMAAGKPLLGAVSGAARSVIEEAACGLTCDPEDAEGLATICLRAAADPSFKDFGAAAKAYYENHFSKDRFFEVLQDELSRLEGNGTGAKR